MGLSLSLISVLTAPGREFVEKDLPPGGEVVSGRVLCGRPEGGAWLGPTSFRGTLTIHLGGRGGVVPFCVPPVRFQIAALSAATFQHVHDLAPVNVPQGGVQVLHCWGEERKALAEGTVIITGQRRMLPGLRKLGSGDTREGVGG